MVRFNLKEPKSKDETLIFLIFRYKGRKFKYSTGEKVKPSAWLDKKMCVSNSYMGSAEKNARLEKIEMELTKIYTRHFTNDSIPTPSILREELNRALNNDSISKMSFFKAFDEFMEVSNVKERTLKKYNTLKNHLTDFQNKKRISIDFSVVDNQFYEKFIKYFIEDKKMLNNTIGKYISTFKTFMHWATDRGYNKNMSFRKFAVPNQKADIVYLEDEELNKILELDLSNKLRLEKVRDLFCLACFTGLRYSDISKLKRENVRGEYLVVNTHKTQDYIKIPLINKAKKIISKYLNKDDFFKEISNQKMNDYLKEIGELAEINKEYTITQYCGKTRIETTLPKFKFISTHTARRTFITLSLEKGMRPETIMEITGHTSLRTMQKYVKIVQKVVTKELKNAWE